MKAVKGHTVCHEFQVKDTATLDFCSEEFGQTTYITPTSLLKKLIQRRSTLNIWWTLTYQFLLVCDIQFLAIIVLLLHLLFQSIFTYNQYSCLENPHGQRSLAGYSPWGHKELDTTEWLSTAQHTVKGFSIVNEIEADAFLEFPCFLYDPACWQFDLWFLCVFQT